MFSYLSFETRSGILPSKHVWSCYFQMSGGSSIFGLIMGVNWDLFGFSLTKKWFFSKYSVTIQLCKLWGHIISVVPVDLLLTAHPIDHPGEQNWRWSSKWKTRYPENSWEGYSWSPIFGWIIRESKKMMPSVPRGEGFLQQFYLYHPETLGTMTNCAVHRHMR